METIEGSPMEVFPSIRWRPFAFWLDSAGGPSETKRWSFLGADPFAVLEAGEGVVRIVGREMSQPLDGDPLDILSRFMEGYAVRPERDSPPFIGGAVGWFGYDLAREWERLPSFASDDTGLPTVRLAFYATVYAYHHESEQLYRIHRTDLPSALLEDGALPLFTSKTDLRAENTFTSTTYREAVHRLKEYIAAGDIYQANLTQRFAKTYPRSPADLYLDLRRVNPAPFGAYLGFGEVAVASASPERFLSVDAFTRRVETRPIKGTRPRSADPGEDRRMAEELRHSAKDRAENLMIVDVHRNDLGRVCEVGSIRVPTLWGMESYATVHHLVSVVEGRLPEDRTSLDLLRAAFPAGSITGAPKLRAMEIIEGLEPVRRGIYTGAIGYLGWDGGMDLSVAIRTLIHQDGWVHYGVGGGIVADSDPDAEYQETLDKARGLEQALAL